MTHRQVFGMLRCGSQAHSAVQHAAHVQPTCTTLCFFLSVVDEQAAHMGPVSGSCVECQVEQFKQTHIRCELLCTAGM